MTRAHKTALPTAAPLAATLRATLAQGWHTLDALDAMAPVRGASDKRRAVHAALGELRAAGCVLEDRVHGGRVEVRLGAPPVEGEPVDAASFYASRTRDTEDAALETWAASKIEQAGGLDAVEGAHLVGESEEALAAEATALINRVTDLARECMEVGVSGAREWAEAIDSLGLSEDEAERMRPVWTSAQDAWRRERVEGEVASAAPPEPAAALDAPAPPVDQVAPVEAVGGPVAAQPGHVAGTWSDGPDVPGYKDRPQIARRFTATATGKVAAEAWTPRHEDEFGGYGRWTWHTWDIHGTGGENDVASSREQMERRVAEALARQASDDQVKWHVVPTPPGPSSRCAVCAVHYARHADAGHPFAPKPRGRPRVAPPSAAIDAPPTAADVLAEIGTPLSRERLDAVRAWAGEGAAEPETSRGGSDGLDADTLDAIREAIDTAPPSVRERVRARRKATETSRGEAPGEQDHGEQGESEATDVGTTDDGGESDGAAPHPTSGGVGARVGGQHAVHERVSGEVESARRRPPRRGGKVDEPVGLSRAEGSDDASTTRGDRPTGGVVVGREAAPRQAVAPTNRAARSPGVDVARAPDAVVRCRPPLCHWDDIVEPARIRSFQRPLCEAHRARVERAGGTVAAVD